ncbi:MAG: hypothetical protein J7L25_07475 [Deltaproteobacteria bacterium]|nr:hypothetical protein [Candidatus Tharpella aukensis]
MSEKTKPAKKNYIEPGQKWQVDHFKPEDAEGVASLFRSVYGDNYPIRAYIDPELLKTENAAGRIISSVAKTPNGDIIGHNALYQSAPYKKIYESGAGVVHADYRGGHGIFTDMVTHGFEVGKQQFGVELVYGETVCNHIFTQKLGHKIGFVTRAIEVDLMPAAAYSKEKSAKGRVSTTLNFKTLKAHPHTIYLPPLYEQQLRFIYETLDDQRTFILANQSLPKSVKTQLKTEVFSFANVARIAVMENGSDFAETLKEEEQRLLKEGVEIFQVWLNLASPDVGAAAAILKQSGYFLGGILPRWFDTDGLLMQKIKGKPNWEEMQIHFDDDRKIVEMVRADWQLS